MHLDGHPRRIKKRQNNTCRTWLGGTRRERGREWRLRFVHVKANVLDSLPAEIRCRPSIRQRILTQEHRNKFGDGHVLQPLVSSRFRIA